ncbi:MAG: RraA family protein [Synergistaceae bacterium]|jgi:regulator of RNase E activity RraA|nr:RraA family protein [Synergistaceae bacterium]
MSKIFDEIIKERLLKYGTCSVSDAMDRMGIACGLLNIKQVVRCRSICGPAFTVHYVPCGVEHGTVGDFLDDVKSGEVVVIDNAGRNYCTVWGGLMSQSSSLRGIEGTVIDGVCRDVGVIHEYSYPIFTKGCYMVTGKDRVEVDATNVKVSVSGVQVKPGDIVLGDDSGVIVIPAERLEQLLQIAEEIFEKEEAISNKIAQGVSLRDARSSVSYHSLQTRSD